ncbi:hypothetical protein MWU50_01845 [Flavobacteriaceae bacterium S0862]|nr:hypothetical protein [Flavobacteriaceae bacterium S0862]
MRKLTVVILLFTFSSCYLLKENGIDLEIVNNSNSTLTNIKFTTSERFEFVEI